MEQLEQSMSGADFRRWVEYFSWRNARWDKLHWLIAQLTSIVFNGQTGEATAAEDWMPWIEPAEPAEVKLTDRELAMQLALSMGAEIVYATTIDKNEVK